MSLVLHGMRYAFGRVGYWGVAKEGMVDNYTLTMLSTMVCLVIFALVVNRLTREDQKGKGKSK